MSKMKFETKSAFAKETIDDHEKAYFFIKKNT